MNLLPVYEALAQINMLLPSECTISFTLHKSERLEITIAGHKENELVTARSFFGVDEFINSYPHHGAIIAAICSEFNEAMKK